MQKTRKLQVNKQESLTVATKVNLRALYKTSIGNLVGNPCIWSVIVKFEI